MQKPSNAKKPKATATTAKMSNLEVALIADNRYAKFIMNEGLVNGKKIALEVYRLFKAETLRRKKLKLKTKAKPKLKSKPKSKPPIVKGK